MIPLMVFLYHMLTPQLGEPIHQDQNTHPITRTIADTAQRQSLKLVRGFPYRQSMDIHGLPQIEAICQHLQTDCVLINGFSGDWVAMTWQRRHGNRDITYLNFELFGHYFRLMGQPDGKRTVTQPKEGDIWQVLTDLGVVDSIDHHSVNLREQIHQLRILDGSLAYAIARQHILRHLQDTKKPSLRIFLRQRWQRQFKGMTPTMVGTIVSGTYLIFHGMHMWFLPTTMWATMLFNRWQMGKTHLDHELERLIRSEISAKVRWLFEDEYDYEKARDVFYGFFKN